MERIKTVNTVDNSRENNNRAMLPVIFWRIIVGISRVILTFLFRIIHKELTEELFSAFMQFLKFGLVGVSNTILSYVLNILALILLQNMGMSPDYDYLVAQFIAFVISVAWSFYWNNKLVFKEEEGGQRVWWKTMIKTYISYSFTGIFLNSILLWIWVSLLHISKLIAPLINLIISIPVNFLINKFWAFK